MAKKLILIFFIIYALFGITNSMFFDTPNATNDFIYHYYTANGDTDNPDFVEFYGDGIEAYPHLFHVLTSPFASSKLLFYLAVIFIICVIAPFLLYKVAGTFSVWIYFALSFPHMVIYNGTFASFIIIIYFLIYLLSKRKTSIFVAMTILSAFTHKYGVYFFAMIFVAEIIEKIILKITWGDKWKLPKLNLGVGFLVGQRLVSINMIINVFLNHMNIYFVYIARKSRDYFLWALFLIGLVGSINFDFRIVMLSQISLCLILGKQLEKEKPSRNFYVICILLMLLNFLSFSWQTEKFLLFS